MSRHVEKWFTFLNEISEKQLDSTKVKELIAKKPDASEYPFENIFHGTFRRIFPINGSDVNTANPRDVEMLAYIDEIQSKLGWEINLNEPFGYATKETTFEKDGKIFKNVRKVKIGPLFAKLSKDAENFWIKNNKFYTSEDNHNYFASKYFIVISRHPMDVLRMSDMEKWSSCHSVGGSYWRCAVDEASSGGAIAYIVEGRDLANIDINGDEIFSDKDRDIAGIQPISRIRIRRFENDDGEELAVPEERSYGHSFPGFQEALVTILAKEQGEMYSDIAKLGKVNLSNWTLVGGDYEDTNARTLFDDFFDGKIRITGNVKHGGQRAQCDIWEEEVNQINADYNNIQHGSVYGNIENYDDGDCYVSYGGSMHISLLGDFSEIDHKLDDWRKQRDFIDLIQSKGPGDAYLIRSDNEFRCELDGTNTNFTFYLEQEDEGISSPDDYRSFADDVKRMCQNYYEEWQTFLFKALRKFGVVPPSEMETIVGDTELENLKLEINDNGAIAELKNGPVVILKNYLHFNSSNFSKVPPNIVHKLEESWEDLAYRALNELEVFARDKLSGILLKSYQKNQHVNPQSSLFDKSQTELNLEIERNIAILEDATVSVRFQTRQDDANGEHLAVNVVLDWEEKISNQTTSPEVFIGFARFVDSQIPQIVAYVARLVTQALEKVENSLKEKAVELMKLAPYTGAKE